MPNSPPLPPRNSIHNTSNTINPPPPLPPRKIDSNDQSESNINQSTEGINQTVDFKSPVNGDPIFSEGVFLGYSTANSPTTRPFFRPQSASQIYARPQPAGPMMVRQPGENNSPYRPPPGYMMRPPNDQGRPLYRPMGPSPGARPPFPPPNIPPQGHPSFGRPPYPPPPGRPMGGPPQYPPRPLPGQFQPMPGGPILRPFPGRPYPGPPDARMRPFAGDGRPVLNGPPTRPFRPFMNPPQTHPLSQFRPPTNSVPMYRSLAPEPVDHQAFAPRTQSVQLTPVEREEDSMRRYSDMPLKSATINTPVLEKRLDEMDLDSPANKEMELIDEYTDTPTSPKRKASQESLPANTSPSFKKQELDVLSVSSGNSSRLISEFSSTTTPYRPYQSVIRPSHFAPSYASLQDSPSQKHVAPTLPPPPILTVRPPPSYIFPQGGHQQGDLLPPPTLFRANSININVNPTIFRNKSLTQHQPGSPTTKRSFEMDQKLDMSRRISMDDGTLTRAGSRPATESDSQSEKQGVESLNTPPDQNHLQAPDVMPTFATLSRKSLSRKTIFPNIDNLQHIKPESVETLPIAPKELSPLELLESNKAWSISTDLNEQFEFAKLCLLVGAPYTEEGLSLLKKVASSGLPDAHFFLGQAYAEDGKHSLAYSQYLMAAKRGYAPACHAIAQCAETGTGCKKSNRLSLEMYTKAATAGNLDSMYRLGLAEMNAELGLKPDIIKAVKWFKRAAAVPDRDHPEPLYELALIYEIGVPPQITPDHSYARGVLIEASEFEYPPALFKLGYCHEHGLMGFEPNPAESIRYYTHALKFDDPEAQLGMAGWHMTGAEGVLPKNEQLAFELVQKATLKQLPRAYFTLGYFYEGGIGTLKNMDQAMHFYQLAADLGEERALERLEESGVVKKSKETKKKKTLFGFFSK
ncbi:hypothetical protein BC833DRAFT_649702 [Globomyces pollinis-pini]|nr:hypothetical protein BC833DRAFT_649702 [Globomyces pollinis-pini]